MKKLYHFSMQSFTRYAGLAPNGDVVSVPVGRIPLMVWPNGRWCWEANTYLGSLLERGLSTRTRGGTLLTYAAHISHLLRYCAATLRRTRFIELTDGQFTDFVRGLSAVPESGPPLRNRNTVRAIGHT